MLRPFALGSIVCLFLVVPASVMAGGPPLLCLPVDGVTAGKAGPAAELLTARLEQFVWPHAEPKVQLQQHANQWYLTFPMGENVRLADVETALRGSGFAIPRDKLRFFGHAILEIEPRTAATEKLIAALEDLDRVSIEKSESHGKSLLVTVDMPYPVLEGQERTSIAWDRFERNDFSFDQSARSEPPASAAELPGFEDFRQSVATHGGALTGVRWSQDYACRPLGAVAAN